MKKMYGYLAVLLTILVGVLGSTTVFATSLLDDEQLVEYSLNDVIFSSPCKNNSSEGVGLLEGKDNRERVWNWFANAGIEGVSDNPAVIAGIVGNIGKESGYNPFATNGTYYGLYQEDSVDMRNYVQDKVGSVNWGSSTDDAEKNSAAIAAELEWLKEHNDFKEFVKNLNIPNSRYGVSGARAYAELFLVQYERAVGGSDAIEDSGVYSYMQKMYGGTTYLYQNAKGRRDEAEKMYKYVQENSIGTSTASSEEGTSSASCNACEEGSLNINGAAVCLAWPLGTDSSKYAWNGGSATPLFQEVYPKLVQSRGVYKGCAGPVYGASCDRFVSTVVRFSGYDKKFPTGVGLGEKSQGGYPLKHKDLWERIDWDGDPSALQAGDIVLRSGHVALAVQDENGDFYIAEAGLCHFYGHIRKIKKKESFDYIIRATNAKNSTVGVDVKNGVSTSSLTGTVTSGTQQGNSDINASAIALAWPLGTAKKTSKSTAYDKFVEYYNSLDGHKNKGGQTWQDGKSCSVFVNTVLLYAGAVTGSKIRSPGGIVDYFIEHPDDWEEVEGSGTGDLKYSDLQGGDVLIYYDSSTDDHGNDSKYDYKGLYTIHAAIYVNDGGENLIAEAHFEKQWGHLRKTSGKVKSNIRVFRWKKQKGGSDCNVCDGGSGGQLKAGGFDTVQEAQEFLQSYHDAAMGQYYKVHRSVNFGVKDGYINDAGCTNGVLNNCVAFSQWFINNYTTVGPNWNNTTNGVGLVDSLVKTAGLTKGTEPRPYAIFSKNGPSDAGHTGVILGVNTEKQKVIVGEAACSGGEPAAREYTFDQIKDWWYAYTDDVISMGGALQNV